MKKYNRIFVIVLDSLGIGAMPDSERFGDTDVDTCLLYTSSHNGLFERQDDLSSVAYWYQSEPHQKFKELLPVEKRWPR